GTLALLLASSALAAADTIFLRGGEKLIGKVISEAPSKVVIDSQTLGHLEGSREQIERIELDAPPAAKPTAAPANRPLVPTPPHGANRGLAPTKPPIAVSNTNAPAKRRWFWQPKLLADEASTDWIQLKSGEWLRGRLYGMQNRKLEFESDELDDLKFDWKDIQ